MDLSRKQLGVLSVVAAALLLAAGWSLHGGGTPPAPPVAEAADGVALDALRARIAGLGEALDRERAERRALEEAVAQLREDVTALAGPVGDRNDEPQRAGLRAPARKPVASRFDEAGMLKAGFDPEVSRQFRSRMDEIDMDRLYLRDQAAREGWLDSQRFKRESAALANELSIAREEFGPEVYDWMLYTTGRPNRVAVVDVLQDSAASQAGLEKGDLIVRYGDERIFSVDELRRETLAGNRGETTPVDLLRSGAAIRRNVPRGPLGIRMRPASVRPPPPR